MAKKRSNKRQPKRQWQKMRYKGRFISKALQEKIRDTRQNLVKQGRFVSYNELLDNYYDYEQELYKRKKPISKPDIIRKEIEEESNIEYEEFSFRDGLDYLKQQFVTYGSEVKWYIRGVGQTYDTRYAFGEALVKYDKEVDFIYRAFQRYDKEVETVESPIFRIPILFDVTTKKLLVDFNEVIIPPVNPVKWREIILDVVARYERGGIV